MDCRDGSVDEPLNDAQVAEFFRHGFLAIETPQIPKSELDWCSSILMRMLESGEGRSEGRNLDLIARDGGGDTVLPSVLQPSLYATELRKLSYRKTALAIARQLLGRQAAFAGDHTIFKPVHKGGPTPWHQDEAFREPGFEYDEISIWIALTDSTIENGAMAYIPGSHLFGLLPHRFQGGEYDRVLRGFRSADGGSTPDSGRRHDHSPQPHHPWFIGQQDQYSQARVYPAVQYTSQNQQENSRGPVARAPAQRKPTAAQEISASRRDFA